MVFLSRPAKAVLFVALGALWLSSFRMADALTIFKTYSSIWFLPAGVTMAIVMAAPGWLKLAPLAANLLLALPNFRALLGVDVVHDYEPLLHGTRLFLIYGGAGLILVRHFRVSVPPVSLADYQIIAAVTAIAVTLATASGIGLHMLSGNMTGAEARDLVWSWWLGDAIGAFAIPPLLLPFLGGLFGKKSPEWHWPPLTSWLTQAALILMLVLAIAAILHFSEGSLQLLPLLIVPPMLFALRGGLPMAATSIFLTVLIVPLLAVPLMLQGTFAQLGPLLLTATLSGLLVGAAMSDRQRVLAAVEDIVEERTRALQEAHEFQRHLVRSIGHDVRQPIESMNMMLEGLASQSHSPDSSAAIRQTRQIGALASQLLSTILSYARLDAGNLQVTSSPFPVRNLFEALAQLYGPFAAHKGVQLVWQEAGETINSDETLLRQLLSNLVDNSIRLSAPGASVTISTEASEGAMIIVVCDTISTDAALPGAAGFGLGIVTRTAELLGASIIAEPNRRGLILPQSRLETSQQIKDATTGRADPASAHA